MEEDGIVVGITGNSALSNLRDDIYDVDITEIEQKVDAAKNHLMDGWVESSSHRWFGIDQNLGLTIQYADVTLAVGDEIAHYNRSETTS